MTREEKAFRINEDYCSYEVSKLLKEKGFDESCKAYYEDGKFCWVWNDGCSRNTDNPKYVSCPSQALAMKWLREVYNLCIAPYAAAYRYGFTIDKCDTGSNICNDDVINEELTTYEEAVEAALKYCLTKLI